MSFRKRAKIDRNQPEIVKALRRVGCSVQSLASLGAGVPDLLVGRRGENFLLEVKDGSQPPSARRLTDDEKEWHSKWQTPIFIVNSVEEALHAVGAT